MLSEGLFRTSRQVAPALAIESRGATSPSQPFVTPFKALKWVFCQGPPWLSRSRGRVGTIRISTFCRHSRRRKGRCSAWRHKERIARRIERSIWRGGLGVELPQSPQKRGFWRSTFRGRQFPAFTQGTTSFRGPPGRANSSNWRTNTLERSTRSRRRAIFSTRWTTSFRGPPGRANSSNWRTSTLK